MGKKILIISNQEDIVLKIKAVSEFLGNDVEVAQSIDRAKQAAQENHSIGLCLISHSEAHTEVSIAIYFQTYYLNVPVYLVRTDNCQQPVPSSLGI